jgi:hypothetical protein
MLLGPRLHHFCNPRKPIYTFGPSYSLKVDAGCSSCSVTSTVSRGGYLVERVRRLMLLLHPSLFETLKWTIHGACYKQEGWATW